MFLLISHREILKTMEEGESPKAKKIWENKKKNSLKSKNTKNF